MFSKITLMIGYAVIRELYRLKTNEKSVVRYDSIIIYPLGRRTKKRGDFGYDVFRINAKARVQRIKLNAEYRLYSEEGFGGMLKQGWLAYDFDSKTKFK
jgi:hypothetical protein